MVVESFDNGYVLISDPKSSKQFKVNGHRLKPYLTAKLSSLGRHPKIILLFYSVFVLSFYQCTHIVEGTHYATNNNKDKFRGLHPLA